MKHTWQTIIDFTEIDPDGILVEDLVEAIK